MFLFTNNSPAAYGHSAVVEQTWNDEHRENNVMSFPDTSFPEDGGQYCTGVTLLTSLPPWHTLLKGINMTLQRRQEICPADARRCLVSPRTKLPTGTTHRILLLQDVIWLQEPPPIIQEGHLSPALPMTRWKMLTESEVCHEHRLY